MGVRAKLIPSPLSWEERGSIQFPFSFQVEDPAGGGEKGIGDEFV